ncbi:Lethal(2) giant larvae protein 1 [Haplosporangium sp. Z 767]|nr:Lethal(2) giant larvae protein 1 [Haplosporangium sp. Z 11]KAF9191733.1 Lethal(2) giant larvae protein 1 [Haplosporangium sp. Z 767]
MAFLNKLKAVVQAEGTRGIRQVLQKEGTKRFAQDLSVHLDVDSLSFCETRRYGLPALISAMAVDPVQGLLACGTFKGAVAVSGASEMTCYLELEEAVSIKMIAFQPGAPVLIVVDAKNAITVFDLIKKQRLFVRNARSIVTCMELLSGSNWLFHGLKDGTIDVFDVYRGQAVPYRIPNILPDGPRHSLVISIKTHPKDNNQLLIAYNTGIALWNLKLKTVVRTFIYEIPPGAMGGIAAGDGMFGINESRYPHVTVVAWKPDGLGFVSGYDDGCFVFWDIRQERPILARTIHELQVNVPGIKPVFERITTQFVPIYQLSWCYHANKEDSTLIIAGGTSSIDMYGLHLFEFPAKADYRSPRRHQTLAMESDLLDFVVLPRNSPWYNGTLDPVAILVLTSQGGVRSFSFDAPHVHQSIPSCLSLVEPRVILAKVYGNLPQDLYAHLVHGYDDRRESLSAPRIPLRGIQLSPVDEARLCRDILVTAHSDCSIRFWEGSSFRPLRHLNVDLGSLFFKNQGEIVAFQFSVSSQVLSVGFANGNWIYSRLLSNGDLSRQSSAPHTVIEGAMNEMLAASMESSLHISHSNDSPKTRDNLIVEAAELQLQYPHSPTQNPQQQESPSSESVAQLKEPKDNILLPDTHDTTAENLPSPTTVPITVSSDLTNVGQGTLSPEEDELDYLVPVSPVEPATVRDLPSPGLNPIPPLPDRGPSPSLPPRPQFAEVSLSHGSLFTPVYKSSSHAGRINQIATSSCGLVAVSDEFYTLSITDTRSGKMLHAEDLKVVILDCDKTNPNNDNSNQTHNEDALRQKNLHAQAAPPTESTDQQSLQRVGVVISTLQFVVSTTSEQDKVPSLLLIAGSTVGIYMIFAISPPDGQPRVVKKVQTFQTKEMYASVHASVINVISPAESAAAELQSTTSLSSVSTTATGSTAGSLHSQPSGANDAADHPLPPLPRRPDDNGQGFVPGHKSSPSESSNKSNKGESKTSIYSSWKEAQEKVISKAQQRLNYLVCVSEQGIRLHMNCTSRRIHKIDLSTIAAGDNSLASRTGRIMAANVIYHHEACCILCLTESGRILLFSVPKLELIPLPVPRGELYLPIVLEPERLRESVILPDGRIFVPILKFEYRMYSLWGHDRWIQTSQGFKQETAAENSTYLQLYDHGVQIPPRPTNAASSASRGWFGLGSSAEEAPSQEDLDELLGGEHYRAENPILKRAGVQGPPGVPPKNSDGLRATSGIAGMMNEALQGLDERGKKLSVLGDKTEEMNVASNNFLAAARELNAKNANKKWYEF